MKRGPVAHENKEEEVVYSIEDIKLQALCQGEQGIPSDHKGPLLGTTMTYLRFIQYLAVGSH